MGVLLPKYSFSSNTGHLLLVLGGFFKSQFKKCGTQVAGKAVHLGLDRRYNITLVQRVPNKDAHRVEKGREERGRRNKSSDVLSG